MIDPDKHKQRTTSRNERFVDRIPTRIWLEQAVPSNPYIAEQCYCHGYNLIDLMRERSYVDVLFLLFRGELPSDTQSRILETLMIALVSPGPRHPATRAAMNAGIGKTDTCHILPISLSVLGGTYLGGAEVSSSIKFLKKSVSDDPLETAKMLLASGSRPTQGDWHIAPGFGSRFGGLEAVTRNIAGELIEIGGGQKYLHWSHHFVTALERHNLGWLATGLCAAVLADLGFHERAGAGLFQLLSSPGLLAHGLEMANKPRTSMPFLDDNHYVIESESRSR